MALNPWGYTFALALDFALAIGSARDPSSSGMRMCLKSFRRFPRTPQSLRKNPTLLYSLMAFRRTIPQRFIAAVLSSGAGSGGVVPSAGAAEDDATDALDRCTGFSWGLRTETWESRPSLSSL